MRINNPTRSDFEPYEDEEVDVHIKLTNGFEYPRARINSVSADRVQFWMDSDHPEFGVNPAQTRQWRYSSVAWIEPQGEPVPIITEPDPSVSDKVVDVVQGIDEVGRIDAIAAIARVAEAEIEVIYVGGNSVRWRCATPEIADRIERQHRNHSRIFRQREAKWATVEHRAHAQELAQ